MFRTPGTLCTIFWHTKYSTIPVDAGALGKNFWVWANISKKKCPPPHNAVPNQPQCEGNDLSALYPSAQRNQKISDASPAIFNVKAPRPGQ